MMDEDGLSGPLRAILRARTAELARPARVAVAPGEPHVVARVERSRYAIAASWVQAAVAVPHVARVPGVSLEIGGLVAYLGAPLPAFSLRGIFSASLGELPERTVALVLGRGRGELALLGDASEGVRRIDLDGLLEPPSTLPVAARDVVRGVDAEGRVVLDGGALLSAKRLVLRSTGERSG